MPHKIQLNELTQVSNNEKNFLSALNDNLQRIQKALDETVSRLGQTPNQMEEVLDMNGHRIVNVGRAQGPLDVVTKQDIQSIIDDAEQAISSLESIVRDAKEALILYGQEIIAEAVTAKDGAVDAKNTAVSAKDTAVASANLAEAARAFIAEDPGFIAVSADLTGDNKIGTVADNLEGSDTIGTVAANIDEVVQAGSNIDAIVAVNANETNINAVNSNKANINTVAGNIQDVVQAGSNISAIQAVNANKANIDTVADKVDVIEELAPAAPTLAVVGQHIDDIETVADDLEGSDNIGTVASNVSNVNAVGSNISNVNAVANNETNINAVNANKANIDTVASNASTITAVANNVTNINAVNANKANIDTVAENIDDISDVADNAADITAVAANISNVNAVANNETNINVVNANKANIDTVAENIDDIKDAPEYAEKARKWAEGTQEEVQGIGGTASAKDWAESDDVLVKDTTPITVQKLYAWQNLGTTDIYYLAENLPVPTDFDYHYDLNFPVWVYTADGHIAKVQTQSGLKEAFVMLSLSSGYYLCGTPDTELGSALTLFRNQAQDIVGQRTIDNIKNTFSTKKESILAYQYSLNSKSSEDNAKVWAEGSDSSVQALGGTHSAKKWAEIAEDAAQDLDDFIGATATEDGHKGLVKAPLAGQQNKFLKGDGTWSDAGANYTDGDGIDITSDTISVDSSVQRTSNLVTSVSASSTDLQYPSAKLLYDTVGNVEATLQAIRGV